MAYDEQTEVEGSLELQEGGGFADDYDGTITAAQFGINAAYNAEAVVLQLVIEADDPEIKPRDENLSIGNGFEIVGRGVAVRNDKGPKFRDNTRIGWWIAGMKDIPGCIEAIVANRGAFPQRASWWIGLRFHLKRMDLENPVTKEVKQQLRPVAFLGFADGTGKSVATAAPVEVPEALVLIAKATETAGEFQEAAVEFFPQLESAVRMQIVNEAQCAALWAELRAR